VKAAIQELARTTIRTDVLSVHLPTELTKVPVPANAIARRYERKQRKADFCAGWYRPFETPALDRPKDLRKNAELWFTGLHGIDVDKRYEDKSVRLRRGETAKRRLPADVKALLPRMEEHVHRYYAQMLFLEQLDKEGKLSPEQRHVLVQRALDGIAGAGATETFRTLNDFYTEHCQGASA
jgi:hypothetical protein